MSENGSITDSLREYVKLSDAMDTLSKNLKELRVQRASCEEQIKTHMEENGVFQLKAGHRKFTLTEVVKSTKKVNKKTIKDCLLDKQVDPGVAEHVLGDLYADPDEQVTFKKLKYEK